MPIKIDREECLRKYPVLPAFEHDDDDNWSYPKSYYGYVVTGSTYSVELINLMLLLGADHLIFLDMHKDDALQVNVSGLTAYLAELDYINNDVYFTDPVQNICGCFCDADNLHLGTKNKEADQLFNTFMKTSQLSFTVCR
jgi:hypothetical protein